MARYIRIAGFTLIGLIALFLVAIMALDPPPLRMDQPTSATLWTSRQEAKSYPGARPSIENGLGCKERLRAHLGHGLTRPIVTFQDCFKGSALASDEELRVMKISRSAQGGDAWALRYDKVKKQMCWLRSRDVELGMAEEYCVPIILDGSTAIQAGDFGVGINFNGLVFDKGSYTATISGQDTTGAIIVYLDCFYPR